MTLGNSVSRKYYLKMLKKHVLDFEVQFRKRYKMFPWEKIYKIDKLRFKKEVPIKVNGTEFSVKELLSELKRIDKDLKKKVKPSYFNIVTSSFMSESKNKSILDIKKIYEEHSKEIDICFDKMKKDLSFSLSALKELTNYLKTQRISGYIMESEEPKMAYKSIYEGLDMTELEVKDTLLQIYEICSEIDDLSDDEEITEGANIQSMKDYSEAKKKLKKYKKEAKSLMKQHKYDEARKICKEMKVVISDLSKNLDAVEGGFVSLLLSRFCNVLYVAVTVLLCFIPAVGGFIGLYRYIKLLLRDINSIIHDIKSKGKLSFDTFNTFRNRLKEKTSTFNKLVDMMLKQIDKEEAEYKKELADKNKEAKVTKENAEYEGKRLSIYQACQNGEITVSEREELLEDLRLNLLLTEATVDATETTEYYTRGEVFDNAKKALYLRCEAGEISVEEREDLIEKAKERIFGETAVAPDDKAAKAASAKEAIKQDSQIEKASAEADKKIEAEADKLAK